MAKFSPRFTGPFWIKRVNPNRLTYTIVSPDGGQEIAVHHRRLRPWLKPPAYIQDNAYYKRWCSGEDHAERENSAHSQNGGQDEEPVGPIDLEKIFADEDEEDEEEDFHGFVDEQLVAEIMTLTSTLLERVNEPEKPSRTLFPSTPTQVWGTESQLASASESVKVDGAETGSLEWDLFSSMIGGTTSVLPRRNKSESPECDFSGFNPDQPRIISFEIVSEHVTPQDVEMEDGCISFAAMFHRSKKQVRVNITPCQDRSRPKPERPFTRSRGSCPDIFPL